MDLLQLIGARYNSPFELDTKTYYSDYLNPEDAQQLRPFVTLLGDKLKLDIPSAIIAVGSSVFPEDHWNYRRELNRHNPLLNAAESYQDIDLLIVPEEKVFLNQLESAIQDALTSMNVSYKKRKDTSLGVAYFDAVSGDDEGNFENTVAPFLKYSYGLHSIETNLSNGTKIDLILGSKGHLDITVSKKLKAERKSKNAFALLYRK